MQPLALCKAIGFAICVVQCNWFCDLLSFLLDYLQCDALRYLLSYLRCAMQLVLWPAELLARPSAMRLALLLTHLLTWCNAVGFSDMLSYLLSLLQLSKLHYMTLHYRNLADAHIQSDVQVHQFNSNAEIARQAWLPFLLWEKREYVALAEQNVAMPQSKGSWVLQNKMTVIYYCFKYYIDGIV